MMKLSIEPLRHRMTVIVAVALALVLYDQTQLPSLSHSEMAALASRFKFAKVGIPEPRGYRYKSVRAVHPSLGRISAWISSLGAAVALADLDGNGLSNDICYVDPRTDLVTIAPAPNTPAGYQPFTLDPSPLPYDPSTTAPMGCLTGDFNEDGLIDLLVYYWGRTPILFLRKGPGQNVGLSGADYTPTEIVQTGERWYTNAAAIADFDGDGHFDIIIGNYFQDGAQVLNANAMGVQEMHDAKAKSFNGGSKRLLLWTGATRGPNASVSFKDVKGVFDEKVAHGWTLAVGAADLDGDLLPEIYFANDFGPDRLLHNRSTPGNPKFVLLEGVRDFTTPSSFVLGNDSFKGMGVDFADLNGDGILDIYVSNIATEYGLQESHFLWLSTGNVSLMKKGIAPYVQASEALGLSRSGWAWDCRLDDFDNDGTPEAIQATGFIKGSVNRWPELQSLGTANSQMMHDPRLWPGFRPGDDLSGHESTPFFVLGKDGRYHDISHELRLDDPMVSRGIAIADVDGDGRLDFVLANQWEPSYLFHNESPNPGEFLGLRLLLPIGGSARGDPSNSSDAQVRGRPAIGATATVHLPDGRKLSAQVDGGSGHSGKRSPEIHFGLGHLDSTTRLQVDLRWRDTQSNLRQETLYLLSGWKTLLLD